MSSGSRKPTLLSLIAATCVAVSSCSDGDSGGAGAPGKQGLDLSTPLEAPIVRSYEVAIATAAADQVRGLEECSERPKAELGDCRKQVNDIYESARSAAMKIRGTDR